MKFLGILVCCAFVCGCQTAKKSPLSKIASRNLSSNAYHPPSGTYYIVSQQEDSGWCIDVDSNNVNKDDANAIVSWPTGNQYQTWYISPAPASGGFTISSNIDRNNKRLEPQHSSFNFSCMCVQGPDDTLRSIHWYPSRDTAYQAWSFLTNSSIPRTYEIINLGSGLAIEGQKHDKTLVQQNEDDSRDGQRWYLQLIQADPGQ